MYPSISINFERKLYLIENPYAEDEDDEKKKK